MEDGDSQRIHVSKEERVDEEEQLVVLWFHSLAHAACYASPQPRRHLWSVLWLRLAFLQRHSPSQGLLAPSCFPQPGEDTRAPEGVIRSRRKHSARFLVSASSPVGREQISEEDRNMIRGSGTRKYLRVIIARDLSICADGTTRYLLPVG